MTLFCTAVAASGQERAVIVRVSSSPPGLPFLVDGQEFRATAAFTWPAGTKHVLSTWPMLDGVQVRTRYAFQRWYAGEMQLQQGGTSVTVTADPAVTTYRAEFGTEYMLSLSYFGCGALEPCQSPGTVLVDGQAYSGNVDLWKGAGSSVALEAVPAPGYVFLGWQPGGSAPTSFVTKVTVTGPMTLTPRFSPARPVRFETVPAGLQINVDRSLATTPARYDWAWNTTHTLSPVSPQFDRTGGLWVFRQWSDGVAAALRPYEVSPGSVETVLTAEYVRGARVTFTTSPPGLRLSVDGRDTWNNTYSFSWGVGETHRVQAPEEQTDQAGRRWMLRGWSNGGPPEQEVSVTEAHAASGLRLVAEYEMLSRLTVQATANGLTAAIDGVPCTLPCTIHRPAGSEVLVSVPPVAALGDDSRLEFRDWGDAAPPERAVMLDAEARVLTANYRVMHRLAMSADPPEGAGWQCAPESADGFYDAQSQVLVRVEARAGFRFRRFEGDLNGGSSSGTLAMSGPKFVRAIFERVPYIDPAGVRNAAGETPLAAVAPGSVISIFGANLALGVEAGPESPLAQAIGGVTVRIGDRMLPLFYVSPEQINAQLPSDVAPGDYSLTVKRTGVAEVRAECKVARNAPGLFQTVAEEKSWAVASHADGTAVTAVSPARRGETITVYGTGFGPYDRRPPDGFAVPESPAYRLADPAEVVAGEAVLQPLWAGAVPGRVGVSGFRLAVAPELASGAVPLKLRVNGQESNSVLLAVE